MQRSTLISAAVAATAVAAAGAGIAQGSSTKHSSAAAANAPGSPGGAPGVAADRDAVHAVGVVLDKAGTAFITQTSDQGEVQSVDSSGNTITVVEGTKTVAYKTVTLEVPAGATVTLDGNSSELGAIKAGDRVSVSSSSDGASVFATDSSFHPEGGPGHGGAGGPGGMAPPAPGTPTTGQ